MKQIIWIYGTKGSGKHQFCQELANESRKELRVIKDIKDYKDLEKYTGQPIIAFETFSPEHCTPDLCEQIINDFLNNNNYFSKASCKLLIITAWYSPSEFYANSEFHFNKTFNTTKDKFVCQFKDVYNFNESLSKANLKTTLLRKLNTI